MFLTLTGFGAVTTAAELASKYLRQMPNAETVIVFAHGFAGDAVSTWRSSGGTYWPDLLTKDPTFDGTDIFVYSYATGPTTNLSIDELAEDMRRTLTAKGVTTHKKLIFLSHSMGGLVTRAYLLKNREIAARTSFAYFFSTSTSGSQIASIADLFLSSTQISKMKTLYPEGYLADLLRQWLAAGFKFSSYCAYEKRPTMGISLVVEMGSAVQLCTKAVDPIDADHIDIVKPESQDSPQYLAFKAAYVETMLNTRSDASDLHKEGACSPAVESTEGNVTITYTGSCNTGITPVQLRQIIGDVLAQRPIPAELLNRYDQISRELGVTNAALTTFLRILGERNVPIEDLDAKLREIAARHLALLKQAEASTTDDPHVAEIKNQAIAAISAGDYTWAEDLLRSAFDAELTAAHQAEVVSKKRYLSAARTKADFGALKLTELQFPAAIQAFQEAADLVPSSEPLVRSEYLSNLGNAARSADEYPLAITSLKEVLSIREYLPGPERLDVAEALSNLAVLYTDRAEYTEAEPLYKRALAIVERIRGSEDPNVAFIIENIAALYQQSGRRDQAEPLLKRALAINETKLGADHWRVVQTLNNLGLLYTTQRRYVEAETLFQRARDIDGTKAGQKRPGLAMTINNLAILYEFEVPPRYSAAEALYKRALAIDEDIFGPEHPNVAVRLNNLALLYKVQGRYADAEPLLQRALAMDEKSFGSQQKSVAFRLNNLAALYRMWGGFHLIEAEPLYQRALAINEATFGPYHPEVAKTLNNLAVLYKALGRYTEAERLYQRALAIDEKKLGLDDPATQSIRRNLQSLHDASAR